jgi:restriction endonuclease
MVMSRDQNARRIQNIRINISSFERVEEFKCLGTTLANQNSIQEEIKSKKKISEIKSRLKSEKACCHSVQNLLPTSLIYNNLKIKIHRTITLPIVFYGYETWSLR